MKSITLFFLVSIFTCALSFAQKNSDTKYVTESVSVEGLIEKPMTLNVEALKQMKVEQRKNYKITNHEGVLKRKVASFKGVALREIIKQASVKLESPKDRGKFLVVVTASDGYQTTFTYNEIMFNKTGNTAFLAFEAEGKPLDQEGKIALYTTGDTATGPRHVRWVQKIEVRKI